MFLNDLSPSFHNLVHCVRCLGNNGSLGVGGGGAGGGERFFVRDKAGVAEFGGC